METYNILSIYQTHRVAIPCLLAAILILLTLCNSWFKRTRKCFPPGPRGLPFLGYLPFLGDQPHETLFKLKEKYGPVMSIRLGTKTVVVLNNLQVIKEAFLKSSFSGRPRRLPFQIADETLGFVDHSGQEWRDQRQFSMKVLQQLGFGSIRMEDHIKDEIFCLMDYLKARDGQEVNIMKILTPSVANVINALSLGRRLEFEDPVRKTLDEILDQMAELFNQVAGVYYMPWPYRVIHKRFSSLYKRGRKYLRLQISILEDEISSHMKVLDPNNPRDYIDSYLLQMNKDDQKRSPYFNKTNLIGNLRLLSGAGADTILASLEWGYLAMAAYPAIQAKVFAEIESIIGRDRSPSYNDQMLMPFTQAVILEVYRWRTNVALNVLRRTTADTSVGGFNIPADTIILANLWAAHNDTELWERPLDFVPERFLEGNLIDTRKSDLLATFSFGPRTCPGKALANLEIFLYFVCIIQSFHITPPKGKILNLKGKLEISYKPLETKLVFSSRTS